MARSTGSRRRDARVRTILELSICEVILEIQRRRWVILGAAMPRFFTLDLAQRLLPEVEHVMRELIRLKADYQSLETELQELARRIQMMGGTQLDPEQVRLKQESRKQTALRLKGQLERIQETGCLVKDLDTGLLDFPTLYRDEEVYLCWRLGEDRIEFWHGLTEGFRGRKRIDDEFLKHHRGD